MRIRSFDWIALTLVIVGAINWGLIGFFQFNLVEAIFGGLNSWISRIIYALVGLAGLYCLSLYGRLDAAEEIEDVVRHD
ncbi:MAG: DUF378 domain-containing protein [Clostridiales bacterium]|jgi:uncharacterized membrane protein YuzA (DUF378 family)|nr:DUF378 domain-containing protein [Clostridiales bacterium]